MQGLECASGSCDLRLVLKSVCAGSPPVGLPGKDERWRGRQLSTARRPPRMWPAKICIVAQTIDLFLFWHNRRRHPQPIYHQGPTFPTFPFTTSTSFDFFWVHVAGQHLRPQNAAEKPQAATEHHIIIWDLRCM